MMARLSYYKEVKNLLLSLYNANQANINIKFDVCEYTEVLDVQTSEVNYGLTLSYLMPS